MSPESTPTETADMDWIFGPQAARWIQAACEMLNSGVELVQVISGLRKHLPIEQASAVIEQATLRRQARSKFGNAQQMFFSDRALQQSSGEAIARYKASRFQGAPQIVDGCCGIGGDLIPLARVAPTIGMDNDSTICRLARANLDACEADGRVICSDVTEISTPDKSWLHIDPDRRVNDRRSVRANQFSPPWNIIRKLLKKHVHAAVKLAPATRVDDLETDHQLEWIGDSRETKQQVLWTGHLAPPGHLRTATVVDADGAVVGTFSGLVKNNPLTATRLDSFVYDFHSVIFASGLKYSFAESLCLSGLDLDQAFFTGPEIHHPLASRFRVVDRAPLDPKVLSGMLRRYDVGHLEIKRRGVPMDVQQRCEQLKLEGEKSLVLLLTRHQNRNVALLAERDR